METNKTGFHFGGIHSCRDMGFQYVERDGHPVIPKPTYNEYTIAGQSGTVLLPGILRSALAFDGTLYPLHEPRNQQEAQRMLRRTQKWLDSGRQQLIFDYEPELYYEAQLTDVGKYSLKNWFGGELPIQFTAQPTAYSVHKSSVSITSSTQTAVLRLPVQTLHPAMLEMEIVNNGTAAITAVQAGSLSVQCEFAGLQLTHGKTLRINTSSPISASIYDPDTATEVNALPHATAFGPIGLKNGSNQVQCAFTFGSGTKSVMITAMARGRW